MTGMDFKINASGLEKLVTLRPASSVLKELRWLLPGALLLVLLVALGESRWLQEWPAGLQVVVKLPRLLLGFAYVFYLPGYWLTSALFPEKKVLDGIERAGLGVGLSIAWVAVLAVVLDYLPWGLRLWPVLLGELASIALFATVAWWRRPQLLEVPGHIPPEHQQLAISRRALPASDRLVLIVSATVLLLLGLATASVFLQPSTDEFVTEFYILGKEGMAEAYPREAAPSEELWVTVGIHNLEREAQTYRVEVWAVDPWQERREQVQTAGPFTLARDETVEQRLAWTMPWHGDDQMVEFYLVTAEQEADEPYRQLRLWLDVEE